MSEESTVNVNGAMPAVTSKVSMKVGNSGGSFGLDDFARATGEEVPDFEVEAEVEEEEVLHEEPVENEEETREDSEQDEESEKTEETEETEEVVETEESKLEEIAVEKSGIKAKTKDGKEVFLPDDIKIVKKIDGEYQEISLKEHLDVVAGELTVNQRLGKLASFREELIQKEKAKESQIQAQQEQIQNILKYCDEGKPQTALLHLGELTGQSPFKLYKKFLQELDAAYKSFEGWDATKIDNWFLQNELEWQNKKLEKEAKKESLKKDVDNFLAKSSKILKDEGISDQEFAKAAETLKSGGYLEGMSRDEAFDYVVERVNDVKHEIQVKEALKGLNPKLVENTRLVELLAEKTDRSHSAADIQDIAKMVLGEQAKGVASNLSKKVSPNRTVPEKKSEVKQGKKALMTSSDFSRLIG